VPGGGLSFLKISMQGKSGVLAEILKEPMIQICKNAGVDPKPIMFNLSESYGNIGYNAKSGLVEDLVEAGVIDPVKVLRCSLQNAASSAGMLITAECVIADTL
jgi:chaperonin GroEL